MLMWAQVETMLGQGKIVASDQGLCYFAIYDSNDDIEEWVASHFFPETKLTFMPDHPYFSNAATQLDEYLKGKRYEFTLSFDLRGTQFQKKVWAELLKVSYGHTISYGELAAKSGYSGAARAVGSAMKTNPLPLFVPCHRVLRANGSVGNYGGGEELKRWLLQLEGAIKDGTEATGKGDQR